MMTKPQVKWFQAALERKRRELMIEIHARTPELAIAESGRDLIDQIQSMTERDEAAGNLARLSWVLSSVERSLRALENGSYGVCVECGETIAFKRLETIPWTSRCIACQELLERQGALCDEKREAA